MLLERFIEGMTHKDLPLLESLLHDEMLFLKKQLWRQSESGEKISKKSFHMVIWCNKNGTHR